MRHTIWWAVGLAAACGEANVDIHGWSDNLPEPDWVSDATLSGGPVELAVASDGGLFTLDPLAYGLWRVDARGAASSEFGSSGDGPGEFRRPVRLGVWGDSLWVYDSALRRVTWFDEDGAVLGLVTFDARNLPGVQGVIGGGPPLAEDRYLAHPAETAEVGSRPVGSWPVVILGPGDDWRTVDVLEIGAATLASVPRADGSPWPIFAAQPLVPPRLAFALPGRGDGVVTVHQRTHDPADQFTVRWIDPDGAESATVRVPYTPMEIAPALDSLGARYRRWAASRADPPPYTEEAYLTAMWHGDHPPPVTGLVADGDTAVWLKREPHLNPAVWVRVRRDGHVSRAMKVPEGSELLAARGERLWGIVRDNLDVPRLAQWTVKPHS